MKYQTYTPHPDLAPLVSCYWTLEVPADFDSQKQRIVPDGCIEMAFILGDDIKRYISEEEFILQPRAMMLGQTLEPFYIQPTGYVNTFAVRFYPYGFANFVNEPIKNLANKETPINQLFELHIADTLEEKIIEAKDTTQRIKIIEEFLLERMHQKSTIENIVTSTVDALLATNGKVSIKTMFQGDLSKRRQLERKFARQIGVSPKQLGKVIRLQSALKMLLDNEKESLTSIAYENEYYDQSHFIKDFKEFTGTSPKEFLEDEKLMLSAVFYK